MTRVVAYLSASDAGGGRRPDSRPSYNACLSLAQSLGADLPRHSVEQGGQPYLAATQCREAPPRADELGPGDIALIARFADLGQDAAARLARLTRAGVRVFAADIGPNTPLGTLAPIVDAIDAAYSGLRDECAQLRADMSAERDHWRERHAAAVREISKGAVDRAVAMVASLPVLGERQTNGHAAPEHVGELIRAERERQGLSQAQLGRRINASQGELSKLENGQIQAGPVRDRALGFLFLDAKPTGDLHGEAFAAITKSTAPEGAAQGEGERDAKR